MIIATKRGNILNNCERRIAFAFNTDGKIDSDFLIMIVHRYWPELAKVGKSALGTVHTKKVEGIEFFALCCRSHDHGWFDQEGDVKRCFDAIPGDEPVAATEIGTDFLSVLNGANYDLIQARMQTSEKEIILYHEC